MQESLPTVEKESRLTKVIWLAQGQSLKILSQFLTLSLTHQHLWEFTLDMMLKRESSEAFFTKGDTIKAELKKWQM